MSFYISDVALLRLDSEVRLTDHINVVCLAEANQFPVDTNCVLVGWGHTDSGKYYTKTKHLYNIHTTLAQRLQRWFHKWLHKCYTNVIQIFCVYWDVVPYLCYTAGLRPFIKCLTNVKPTFLQHLLGIGRHNYNNKKLFYNVAFKMKLTLITARGSTIDVRIWHL